MAAPSSATDAVLVPSDPLPEGIHQVRGVDFDRFQGRDITVAEMVDNMADMGFQGSAVSEAARELNNMVFHPRCLSFCLSNQLLFHPACLSPPRNGREDDHFPRIHFQPRFLRSTRYYSLPSAPSPCFRHRHHCRWSGGRSDQMFGSNLPGLVHSFRGCATSQRLESHRQSTGPK